MTQRITITVAIEEEYSFSVMSGEPQTRTRDTDLYRQVVFRTGEPDSNVDSLIAAISKVVNEGA